jgi:EmrB/QacA subfamily drug resistance transporter
MPASLSRSPLIRRRRPDHVPARTADRPRDHERTGAPKRPSATATADANTGATATGATATTNAGDQAKPPSTITLLVILGAYLMVVLDVSVVITALPQIHHALHFSSAALTWVQSAYALTFGGLLLLGARAGDILGRRRVFMAGITLFALSSLAGGLSQSAAMLLTARAVQGIAAAIAAPSTLALLMTSFPEGPARTKAVASYAAVAGGGGSVGLVLGGMLTAWINWRWALFVNVPVGAVLVFLAPRYLDETERRPGHFDLAGAATSSLGMAALVYGFVRAAANGWGDTVTIASFAAAAALLSAFVAVERRAEQPITPLRLFASRTRSGAYAGRVLVVGAMFSMFFFVTQLLQGARNFTPLEAGLAFLPMTLVLFAMVRRVPRIAARVGETRLLVTGLSIAAAGMLWLSQLSATTPYLTGIALPLMLLGVGIGMAFTPLTTAGIHGVAGEDAGAASGLVNAAQQLGGSLGVSVLVTVFTSASRSAAAHPLAGATHTANAHYVLSHAVSSTVLGSAVLLGLALLTVAITVLPARLGAAAAPVATEAA